MSPTESHLRDARHEWHQFIDAFPTPTLIKNADHELIAVSDSFCDLIGLARDQVLGFHDFEIHTGLHLLDREFELKTLETGESTTYQRELVEEGIGRHRQKRWFKVCLNRVFDSQQNRLIVGTVEDTTELNNATRSLEAAENHSQLAFSFDPVTGLMNRSQIEASITDCLNESQQDGAEFAVLLIDLNGFKSINSMLDHHAGDQALRIVASRIREVVQCCAAVARVSADEYVVVLPDTNSVDAGEVAAKINEMIQMPIGLCGTRRELSSSIGVSMFPRDARTSSGLLLKADQAMLAGKRRTRSGCVEFYEPRIGNEAQRSLMLARDLVRAVRDDRIELHFQPIVRHDAGLDRVIGYEALARWRRDNGEWVSPEEFIPLLEQTGLIVQAGENILTRACEFIGTHASEDVYVSVNVSGQQLLHRKFVDMADRVIQSAGVSHQRIAIELTETLAMDDDTCGRLLNRLIKMGIRLMIDDFGTGYSNLSRLRKLPFSMLKIDRSLVSGVPSNKSDCVILRTLISMARELEMSLVVEGIEEQAQRDFLADLGVDMFQGYLFGKPKPLRRE